MVKQLLLKLKKLVKYFFFDILKNINKKIELKIKITINSRLVSISSPAIKEKIIIECIFFFLVI